LVVDVVGVSMRDGAGAAVDFARDHASLERTPPARAAPAGDARYDDPDALRVVIEAPEELAALDATALSEASIAPVTGAREPLDQLRVALVRVRCRAATRGVRCAASAPVRFVIDEVDQKHPLVRDRSLRAQVGGAIVIRRGARKLQAIRVLGPRATAVGPV